MDIAAQCAAPASAWRVRSADEESARVRWQASMRVAPDARLVRQARRGRRDAFDELVERYQRRAAAVAYRLVGNPHDALEVCQEALLRAHQNLGTLEDPARFGPWLLRIVTNQALNFRRARGPRACENGSAGDMPAWEDQVRNVPSPDDRPGAPLATAELAARIRFELARLPERQRGALVLFSMGELPQKQVAQILGCSVAAVKWHVFQARRKLRTRLADYLEA
jgi:RNA polymerase sigma-70 factor (ECF subfamily)